MKTFFRLFLILGFILIVPCLCTFSQVGINTDDTQPDPSAILDVKSISKGMLIPRMTQSQIAAIISPANGLVVFCTTDDKSYVYVTSANVWKEILYNSGTIAPINIMVPYVTTTDVTNITQNTATSGGNVISERGAAVTARGVCWSTSASPTIADSHTTNGTGTGVYVSNLTGLLQNIHYYIRAYATNSTGTAYGDEERFTTLPNGSFYIGKSYGGGIVFYVDAAGQHGLISATSDQSTGVVWGCKGSLIGGTSTAIGTGQANTTAIIGGCSTSGIPARICNDLVLNGYDDWFLPSMDELREMYWYKTMIGGFAGEVYWSSSEYDADNAWYQYFVSDAYGQNFKDNAALYVRAIRAF